MSSLLEVKHLGLTVTDRRRGSLRILHDVSFDVAAGEAVGIVGESGSGKSMTVRAIDRLLPLDCQVSGSVRFAGQDVLALSGTDLARYRGNVAMVFQDPRAHVNPLRTVGQFMVEALTTNGGVPKAEAERRSISLLDDVGVDRPAERMRQYPYELSGGLLQRVMIASALLTEPRLLLADEPTTALDVTTQSEVMAILDDLRRERGMSLVLITHDLDLAAAVCDRTMVMYAGSIVEQNESSALHEAPLHPYTAALADARPSMHARAERLTVIPGRPLSGPEAPQAGCAFAPRCGWMQEECLTQELALVAVGSGMTRCRRHDAFLSAAEAPHG